MAQCGIVLMPVRQGDEIPKGATVYLRDDEPKVGGDGGFTSRPRPEEDPEKHAAQDYYRRNYGEPPPSKN